ncbi:MAG TPA: M36 family metallopeptidase [Candidatus Limnocylindria bacterium]|nr:M36 family metallopeptidase [Candidatus Limnocylindria bacterium]
MSGPRSGSPAQIVINHVRGHARGLGLRAADVADIAVTKSYTDAHNGVTHVYLRQRYNGIEVYNANANANVARDGSIISLHSSFVRDLAAKVKGKANLSAEESIRAAARQLGTRAPVELAVRSVTGGADREITFARNGISQSVIPTKLVYQQVKGGNLRLARQIELYELDGDHWWNLRVDATTGVILARSDYVSHADDAYRVFAIPTENPEDGPRTLVMNPASAASPLAWHNNGVSTFTTTQGNNVLAYTDRNADNLPDTGSQGLGFANGGSGLVFDFDLDLSGPPESYQAAAVTNLFYWNNVIHDVLYGYGFDEKSGNFQFNNFGPNAGKGGDPVRAEAQDGSGRNNANFATPPDGFAPRMQMFEWRDSEPNPLTVEGFDNPFFGPMAGFGASLATTGPISGELMVVDDGTAPTSDGCQAFTLPANTIPLIDRGTCTFVVKVKNAQNAGAAAAVVANNIAGAPIGMGGADPTITIPSIMISLADANTIKPALPAGATLAPADNLLPDRDSDLDSGVIAHEYGHGLSNRLTGGNVGCLDNPEKTPGVPDGEQMGEGWSDFLALVLTARSEDTATTSRGVGNYVVFEGPNGVGIRPTPYTTDMTVNPATYQDVIDDAGTTLSIPHGVGYVWASTIWEVYWNLVDASEFNPDIYDSWETGGNNLALQLVIDGMKFQPCNPGFVTGRDAILEADLALTGGENQCLIWEGFAKRGVGFSAEQRSSQKTADGTAAFDLPPECASAGIVVPIGLTSLAAGGLEAARRQLRRRWMLRTTGQVH